MNRTATASVRGPRRHPSSLIGLALFALIVAGAVLFLRHPPARSVAAQPPLGATVQPARLLFNGVAQEPYPTAARTAGQEGVATLRLVVRADGTVERCLVRQGSGVAALDQASCAGLRRSVFHPALGADGRPVRSELDVPIAWRLPN